jgi:uncharacterized OsmC-like protein
LIDHWYADELTQSGGKNSGPDPYEYLLAALGTCTAMSIRMYADHKKISLQHDEVSLSHERHYLNDVDKASEHDQKIESLLHKVQLFGLLSDNEKKKLIEIADRCPVHRTLHNNPQILTVLIDG